MEKYQEEFVSFLVQSEALRFGDFVTKSGRKTPYFVNTGQFSRGSDIHRLGNFYAEHLIRHELTSIDTIFGPAYKGVPLCVATAIALYEKTDSSVGYTFNRKETKGHGDKGLFVGKPISDGDSLVLVEDVITAGTTLREVVPLLRGVGRVSIEAVVISVDRSERGTGKLSAVQDVESELGVRVLPLVTIHEILEILSRENASGLVLDAQKRGAIQQYLEEYGAQ